MRKLLMPRPDGRSSRYSAARYARQRRLGYPWLRFARDLEREYLEGYVQMNASRIRLAHTVGILGIFGFIALDQFLGSALSPPGAIWVAFAVTVPALLVPVIATFDRRTTVHLQTYIAISVLVAGLSIDWIVYLGHGINAWYPYESILLITTYVYFLSGLLWLDAFLCGVAIWAGYVAVHYWFTSYSLTYLLYDGYHLALTNVIGWIGRYIIEYQDRMSFLAQRELRYLAQHDSLTGLMNRRAFRTHAERVLAQASRDGRTIGLLLFDLDHFKRINDTWGHLSGDAVLRVAAATLKGFVRRPLDAAGRFGGDEFVAMWYDIDREWFQQMQRELPAAIKAAISSEVNEISRVTISGGAVLAWPQPGLSLHDVLREADKSLYGVKRESRDQIVEVTIGQPPVGLAAAA